MDEDHVEGNNAGDLSGIDAEWARVRYLIPEIVGRKSVEDRIESEMLGFIDGRSTCDEIVKLQDAVSMDGMALIIRKLERDGIVRCFEPVEKLRDIRIEKHDAQKELKSALQEKERVKEKVSRKRDEIYNEKIKNRGKEKAVALKREKIERINDNIKPLYDKRRAAMDDVNRLVNAKMDILRRDSGAVKAAGVIKEEVIYLRDEKLSAMRSLKDLEYKIEEVFRSKESVTPKVSVCRGLVREAYKTLRDVRVRADYALKEVETY